MPLYSSTHMSQESSFAYAVIEKKVSELKLTAI